jgi:hypothetical protein
MNFYELMNSFDSIGGFDLLLPFILVFTLVFAVLQKIQLFGTGRKNINAVIALVVSLFFLNNTYLIYILQRFLPNVSIVLIVFLAVLLLVGIFGTGNAFKGKTLGGAFLISIIAVLFALVSDIFDPYSGPETGFSGIFYRTLSDSPGAVFAIFLIVFIAVFIFRDDASGGQGFGKVLENIGRDIGRGNN